jgi:hypothetical protein
MPGILRGILKDNEDGLDDELKANFTRLDAIFERIIRMVEDTQGDENLKKEVDRYERDIARACTRAFLGAVKPESIVIALTQYGLARDLLRAGEGILSLRTGKDGKLFKEVTALLLDAYTAFEKRDAIPPGDIRERYTNILIEWKKKSDEVGYAKIAANGFYISRVLGKPVNDLSMFESDEDHI